MGTSSSYGGPGKGGGLLPPWAEPVPGEGKIDAEAVPEDASWPAAKAQMTQFGASEGIKTDRGRAHLSAAGRHFVRSQGGARSAARGSRSGRASAQRLAGFLSALSTLDLRQAASRFDLQAYVGSKASDLLAALVDRLAPTGAQLEDAAARSAMVATLSELFRERGAEENGLEALQSMSADDVREVVLAYVVRYLDERIAQVLAKGLEDRPADDVLAREKDIHRFIEMTVRLDMSDMDVLATDWSGIGAVQTIERIFQDAYDLIENA
jgi:hypothetical protein